MVRFSRELGGEVSPRCQRPEAENAVTRPIVLRVAKTHVCRQSLPLAVLAVLAVTVMWYGAHTVDCVRTTCEGSSLSRSFAPTQSVVASIHTHSPNL